MIANPENRHPDIEIYIAGAKAADVDGWLRARLDQVETTRQQGNRTDYRARIDSSEIPVMVMEKAAGRFTSVWFDSAATPWARDLDCARDAAAYFEREIRCIASGWKEGDDPDEWWSVSADGEQLISWRES